MTQKKRLRTRTDAHKYHRGALIFGHRPPKIHSLDKHIEARKVDADRTPQYSSPELASAWPTSWKLAKRWLAPFNSFTTQNRATFPGLSRVRGRCAHKS